MNCVSFSAESKIISNAPYTHEVKEQHLSPKSFDATLAKPLPKVSLIVLPEARQKGIDQKSDPFISFIDRAKKEIVMASYKLQEKKLPEAEMLHALKRASERGVKIHLIAENRLTKMEEVASSAPVKKGDSLKAYEQRGVNVYHVSSMFDQSHTKFIVIDRKEALIGSTNFDKEPEGHKDNARPSRDFAIRTAHPEIIEELLKGFWSDAKGSSIVHKSKNLLWGPAGQRKKIEELIHHAENSIRIYQQDFTDLKVLEALLQAVKNGVHVELIMSPHPFGFNRPDNNTENQKRLEEVGGRVYLTNQVNVHAKVLIIDDRILYIGSTNFYQPSIDKNRNVGLLTQDQKLIAEVLAVFKKDKQSAESASSIPTLAID